MAGPLLSGPAASQDRPGAERWQDCTFRETARKAIVGTRDARAVVTESFDACRSEEEEARAEVVDALGADRAEELLHRLRRTQEQKLIGWVNEVRRATRP
jgi:hypothetical protein